MTDIVNVFRNAREARSPDLHKGLTPTTEETEVSEQTKKQPRRHIMLDLETMGTRVGSAVVAIGAITFTPEEGLLDQFYETVDLQSCLNADLMVDGDTIMWWMNQEDAARKEIGKAGLNIITALTRFSHYVSEQHTTERPLVWGNGASFDNAILFEAYKRCNVLSPFTTREDRCYRTLKHLYPEVPAATLVGVKHKAVDDAVYQARHTLAIVKATGITLG